MSWRTASSTARARVKHQTRHPYDSIAFAGIPSRLVIAIDAVRTSPHPTGFSVTARKLLLQHPWPGNIREMLNTLRPAAVWTPGSLIDRNDARDALLPCPEDNPRGAPILAQDVSQGIDLNGIIDQVARHYLEEAMQVTSSNKARAAKLLGFGNATTLTNWLKRHGVEP